LQETFPQAIESMGSFRFSVRDLIGRPALKNWASALLNPAIAAFLIFGFWTAI
jgi:hypothetical protein